MEKLITISNLCVGYNNKPLLADINGSFLKGEFSAIIGRNGKGKSTLLKTIAKLLPAIDGGITINGASIDALNEVQLSKLIGVVLTHKISINNIAVKDFIAYGRYPYTSWLGSMNDDDNAFIEKAIELCDIGALSSKNYNELSDGEKQKVNIARVIAQNTPVILLDEPTAHLDLVNKLEVFKLLKKLSTDHNKAVIISTHQIELALPVSDKIWMISDQGLSVDTPNNLIESGKINALFEGTGIQFDRKSNGFQFK